MTAYEPHRTTGPVASGSLAAPPTPTPQNSERDPAELRAELSRLRTEVGATVDALVGRLDVPARVQGKAHELTDQAKQTAVAVVDQAQQKAHEASQLVAQRMPDVVKQHSGRTAAVAAGLLLVGLVVAALTRRSG